MSGKYDFSSCEPNCAFSKAVNSFCQDLLIKEELMKTKFRQQILKLLAMKGSYSLMQ